jgi:hypothetical protein
MEGREGSCRSAWLLQSTDGAQEPKSPRAPEERRPREEEELGRHNAFKVEE